MSARNTKPADEQFARAVPKNDYEEVRVRIMRTSDGVVYADFRQFIRATDTRSDVATFKGFSLPLSSIEAFLDALMDAQAAVLKRPGGRKR